MRIVRITVKEGGVEHPCCLVCMIELSAALESHNHIMAREVIAAAGSGRTSSCGSCGGSDG